MGLLCCDCHWISPSTTVAVGVRPIDRATALDAAWRGWMRAPSRSDALPAQPVSHEAGGLLGQALALLGGGDHPGEIGGGAGRGIGPDRGLGGSDRGAGGLQAHHPVQPALAPVGRAAADLPREARAELLGARRPAADELVQRQVVEHRRELVGVLDPQRLEDQPLGLQKRRDHDCSGDLECDGSVAVDHGRDVVTGCHRDLNDRPGDDPIAGA
jgi:hypothetical protein